MRRKVIVIRAMRRTRPLMKMIKRCHKKMAACEVGAGFAFPTLARRFGRIFIFLFENKSFRPYTLIFYDVVMSIFPATDPRSVVKPIAASASFCV